MKFIPVRYLFISLCILFQPLYVSITVLLCTLDRICSNARPRNLLCWIFQRLVGVVARQRCNVASATLG